MNASLVLRQATLAGVALLAALGAVALGRAGENSRPAPPAVTTSSSAWEEARVAVVEPGRAGQETACGITLAPQTLGVVHPVLPCGVELVLAGAGREVRTEVIEKGAVPSGRAFAVTEALARELRLAGDGAVRWRFAG
jgi:hypothetical protein